MFKIENGRQAFYQWDSDQRLIVLDSTIKEVHFCNRTDDCSLVCEVFKEDGKNLVNVPNVLLQNDWDINVYGYDTSYTKFAARFKVNRRTKPADYVYTETELLKVEDYVEKALQEAKESGEFDGPVGPQGPAGAIKFLVVTELPTENIDANTIYLVKAKTTDEKNVYEEFIYINGEWEGLGVIPVEVDLSDYVKKTQFADKEGNAGILRLKSSYGISSGRYDGNSPESGDCALIASAREDEIKARQQNYKPIVPRTLDYAVKMALTDCKIEWTEAEKKAVRLFLGIDKPYETILEDYETDGYGNIHGIKINVGEKYIVSVYNVGENHPMIENKELIVQEETLRVPDSTNYVGMKTSGEFYYGMDGSEDLLIQQVAPSTIQVKFTNWSPDGMPYGFEDVVRITLIKVNE